MACCHEEPIAFWSAEADIAADFRKANAADQLALRRPHCDTAIADGTTGIDVVIVREGKNLKGRVIGAVLGLVGKRVFSGQFEKTVKAIETRSA